MPGIDEQISMEQRRSQVQSEYFTFTGNSFLINIVKQGQSWYITSAEKYQSIQHRMIFVLHFHRETFSNHHQTKYNLCISCLQINIILSTWNDLRPSLLQGNAYYNPRQMTCNLCTSPLKDISFYEHQSEGTISVLHFHKKANPDPRPSKMSRLHFTVAKQDFSIISHWKFYRCSSLSLEKHLIIIYRIWCDSAVQIYERRSSEELRQQPYQMQINNISFVPRILFLKAHITLKSDTKK